MPTMPRREPRKPNAPASVDISHLRIGPTINEFQRRKGIAGIMAYSPEGNYEDADAANHVFDGVMTILAKEMHMNLSFRRLVKAHSAVSVSEDGKQVTRAEPNAPNRIPSKHILGKYKYLYLARPRREAQSGRAGIVDVSHLNVGPMLREYKRAKSVAGFMASSPDGNYGDVDRANAIFANLRTTLAREMHLNPLLRSIVKTHDRISISEDGKQLTGAGSGAPNRLLTAYLLDTYRDLYPERRRK